MEHGGADKVSSDNYMGEFLLKRSSKLLDMEARPGKDAEAQHVAGVQVMVKFSV